MADTAGYGNSLRVILLSAVTSLLGLSYVILIGLLFEPDVYYFQNGTTYHRIFSDAVLSSEAILMIVVLVGLNVWIYLAIKSKHRIEVIAAIAGISTTLALVGSETSLEIMSILSVPGIIFLILYNKQERYLIENPRTILRLTINYLCMAAIMLSILSLCVSFSGSSSIRFDVLYQLFVLFSALSPILIFAIIMSLPIKIIIEYVKGYRGNIVKKENELVLSAFPRIGSKTKVFFLSLFIVFSIVILVVPQTLLQEGTIVGVDTETYLEWNHELDGARSLQEYLDLLFVKISDGDRPLSLLFIHLVAKLFTNLDPDDSIEIVLAIIIGPLLILVVYLLCKELTDDDYVALFGSFLTSVGFQLLIGIYAGFYANWLSLIPAYLALTFLLRFLKSSKHWDLLFFGLSLFTLLFVHVYTWTIVTLFVIIFLLYSLSRHYYKRRLILISLIIVGLCVVTDAVRSSIISTSGGLERDLSVAEVAGAGLAQFNQRWDNLVRTVQVHVGGFYSNFVVLSLVLYGLLALRMNDPPSMFVIIFVSVLILPMFFGNMVIMSRIIYDIPLQIPAAMALTLVYRGRNGELRALALSSMIVAISIVLSSNLS